MQQRVSVKDKEFEIYLHRDEILHRVQQVAARLAEDYLDKNPLFIAILNGSFMFTADICQHMHVPAEISFIKLRSYSGTQSTGKVTTTIGLNADIKNRHVVIVEDIIDTGKTLSEFLPTLIAEQPASLKVVTCLSKPSARQYDVPVDYFCFEIPDKFVVGYGLDYDGAGRNLPHIYSLV